MLLPNVTPSPAPPIHSQLFDGLIPELPTIDAAALTMLRLQLASAENLAGERLLQIQSLQGQLYALKQSRQSVEQELALNVSQLEAQMRESLAGRARVSDSELVDQLQGQLRDAEACLQLAVDDAVAEEKSKSQSEMRRLLHSAESKWTISATARLASERWNDVRDMAECEVELITAKREALVVILADLESRHALLP
ncbi:hypothetical protein BD410DRAFT_781290 [Rickenella mellea]|uniref:Uncharacterized protein n=1 Tax=Rickenella mellea TaxID=50990 RepID=A0A4Y7QM86_9AGAM|nr:hypothetical protein BD410DRAFT_781290 [Rickenella mellea]